jgi:NitT/TauT family transport system substrate-binding protein
VTYFNSGSDAGNALLSGSIDATYIGPGPASALYLQSEGGVAIVSGVASGGAAFVVRKGAGIETTDDLSGKKIAVPGIGNTQDVALRTWLHDQGLEANDAGGDVSVAPIDNPELVGLFEAGHIDGAWEPEPWPSLLVAEGLAEPFVDEADLWPDGEFTTTVLLVNSAYLGAHPDIVRKLVDANVRAIEAIQDNPAAAKAAAQAGLIRPERRRWTRRSWTRPGASSRSHGIRSPRAWRWARPTRSRSATSRPSRGTCPGCSASTR